MSTKATPPWNSKSKAVKNMRPRLPSEHAEQVRFVEWFRRTYPQHEIFAIPNGGKRDKITAARLKREGATAGIPDLYIRGINTWVEMKKQKGGVLSEFQKKYIKYFRSLGDNVIIGYGYEDAKTKVIKIINGGGVGGRGSIVF